MTGPHDADGAHPDGRGPDDQFPHGRTPDDYGTDDHDTDEHGTDDPTAGHAPTPAPSGLRNPAAAVRGVGAGALAIEAVILLLAIVPLRVLDVRNTSVAMGCVLGIVVLCVLLAGMMRRDWAWKAGIVPPILVIACGYFHFSLAIIGVFFLLVWLYVLSVRRTVLGQGHRHGRGQAGD